MNKFSLLFLCLLMIIGGCGNKKDKPRKPRKYPILYNNKQVSYFKQLQKKVDEQRKLRKEGKTKKIKKISRTPDGKELPINVYVYEKAWLQSTIEIPNGFSIVLKTVDLMREVEAVYLTEMNDRDWDLEDTGKKHDNIILYFIQNNYRATITLSPDEGSTIIRLTASKDIE